VKVAEASGGPAGRSEITEWRRGKWLNSGEPSLEHIFAAIWAVPFYRCVVHDLAVGITDSEGSHIGRETIRAEFRALLAETPGLSVCSEHTGELATAREAMGQAPPPSP
jgi:hypothetical protein